MRYNLENPMRVYILLSIQRKYLDLILKGEKTIEIRKRLPEQLAKYYFVCEGHVHAAIVSYPLEMTVDQIMNSDEHKPGIDRPALEQYAAGQEHLQVLRFATLERFQTPIPITAFGINKSPQSFCYARKLPAKNQLVTTLDHQEDGQQQQ